MSLDSIPTLPRSQNVSGDDLLPIIDMSDRRSPKAVTLSDAINAALEGETLEVAGVTLTDTSGVALAEGTLGLNGSGDVVVHDNTRNGGELDTLVSSKKASFFAKAITAASMNNQVRTVHLCDIPLSAAEATSGNTLYIKGHIFSKFSPGQKPDAGVYLIICFDGNDPALGEGLSYPIAAGSTSESNEFFITIPLVVSGLNWEASLDQNTVASLAIVNNAGTITLQQSMNGFDSFNSNFLGPSGQANRLRFYIYTSDSSNAVTSNLYVGGQIGHVATV